ncbi:hypothetical protein [Halosegnis marinus]|uniref:DUF3592 domain-containing protein n=1 Tax=Halosegnis marinus TaxID=3034023 RepID=A0ABD5ZQK0_9EURY|nr:hypothetical protein [Halosegnis sp. DT85]
MSEADEPWVVTYAAPLVGVLLVVVGISAGVLGGYSVVQSELGLCGSPSIHVASEETTAGYVGPDGPSLERLPVENLTDAEAAAFRTALDAPTREASIDGDVEHLAAFRAGVLVTYDGGERYVTLASLNECVGVPPLLFPLGVAAILFGAGGVLTPPLYRRLDAFENAAE